ncbi:hypothetical protein WA026_003484 [Henosepilachna vigintioctopunctata]|uniref:RRM domain-containing protein n=1 Tax=Henosepilachna vigintioctopunctata TaxID=420089 RepID=A0AAW1TN03_9CUCU
MSSLYATMINNKLFIIGSKSLNENDYRDAFKEFGEIEEIWVVKDRNTGENKGVTYIKFAKTSQAARALEAMNGKFIGNVGRNIKVMIAASKDQGAKRDDRETEEERTMRLFVKIPKDWSKTELYDAFKKYGNIDYANIVRDRNTSENKGFGFVKFLKFSDAARAFEECDKDFRAVFAEPKKSASHNKNEDTRFSGFNEGFRDIQSNFRRPNSPPFPPLPDVVNREGYTGLIVSCSPSLTQDELTNLFNIVPELDYCTLRVFGSNNRFGKGVASVGYHHPKWAAYALEKLHGFEYPRGMPLLIKPDFHSSVPRSGYSRSNRDERVFRESRSLFDDKAGSSSTAANSDLLKLAETLAQASSLLQSTGLTPDLLKNKMVPSTDSVCNVKLPDPKPLENIDAKAAARCFIVCSPNPPPMNILRDIFCRFGNLIDVYLLSGKNCGYAKYSVRESAERAIEVLHGAEICGCRIKVIEAEEQPEYNRKRARFDENLN